MLLASRSIWLLSFVGVFALQGTGEPPSTTVEIAVTTTEGTRIDNAAVDFKSLYGSETYRISGKRLELELPTGRYLVTASAQGFHTRYAVVRAFQPRVFYTISLPIDVPHTPDRTSLTVAVANMDATLRNMRVRLLPIYGAEVLDVPLTNSDSIVFPEIDPGPYLLVVVADSLEGNFLLDSRPVVVSRNEQKSLTVDLKGSHGQRLGAGNHP